MKEVRDWQQNRAMWIRVLEESTGENVEAWNRRIQRKGFREEQSLRAWLAQQGVTGYAQTLLVMERFGYPDFITASADQFIHGQYADRPQLRPIYDAIIHAASEWARFPFKHVRPTSHSSRRAGRLRGCSPRRKPAWIWLSGSMDRSPADAFDLLQFMKR